eukprot:Rmarinus@m.26071
MQAPVLVLNQNTKKESGREAQLANIQAARAVSECIRSTLGPKAMLKMIIDAMGGIVMTNDGNAILREIDVSHPAAKSMIELSRTQDEEVGDGTTSVIILAGEMLYIAQPFLERDMHPTVIVNAFFKALDDAIAVMDAHCVKVDVSSDEEILKIIKSSLGTKYLSTIFSNLCDLALKAVRTVYVEDNGHVDIDIKKYAKVEKIPGGELTDCQVLDGVMFNKDITHPKMRRRIEKPRILLLDCPLEYKKGESSISIEMTGEDSFAEILRQEEEYIEKICSDIIKVKPDVIITEKGLSDLAQHFLMKAGITCLRRLRKTDNNRVARASGATIVSRTEDIKESDVGTECGLFEIRKIGDEYFTFIVDCKSPKACSILLRGGSKDVLNEMERHLQDAMNIARNIMLDPRLVPGGGAIEMTVSAGLQANSKKIEGVEQWPYCAVAMGLEVIPRTLAENCGASVIRLITELRAKHSEPGNESWGVDGEKGVICDVRDIGVWEPYVVKAQTIKTAIEAAALLLRIDAIVSGLAKNKGPGPSKLAQQAGGDDDDGETFGDARDG